jgi:flagellar FliL protein
MAKDVKAEDEDEGSAPAAPVKAGGGMKKILLIALGAFLLVGLSVGGTLVATSLLGKAETPKAKSAKKTPAKPQEPAEEEAAEPDAAAAEAEAEEGGEDAEPAAGKTAFYLDFEQPFVVNFQDEGQLRYLQVSVAVMGRDEKMPETVKRHMPRIRNNLVMLFSSLTRDTIVTREGKEKIRAEAQSEVQKILREQTGQPVVEQLYLTSLVMQ